MLRASCYVLLLHSLLSVASATVVEFPVCNCDGDGIWGADGILRCQKASDFLIAAAYFSIPIELFYFVSCSTVFPFKWVLFQFGAFIVLCGLTHFLTVFTYEPHSFLLMLSLTVSKFLTALVSFLTSITLLTLIPQLLRVKMRESLLRTKACELDREVGLMKRKKEASWHVRMLTQEIRKSLDRHTILYTTLVELSRTLDLQTCVVWMPDNEKMEMRLTHELSERISTDNCTLSTPIDDPEVMEVNQTEGATILKPDSALGCASSGAPNKPGAVAAIRMPMLNVSDFRDGTPKEVAQACYAILVLVLPQSQSQSDSRTWSRNELEIVEVVADQVAVALSHAAVLEETHMMRDKLTEQNRGLLQAKHDLMMAGEARDSFQRVISQRMRRTIHSVIGMLSMMEQENLTPEQRLVIDATAKTGSLVSTLIDDVVEVSVINRERFSLGMRPFQLQKFIKEAVSIARCICDCKGFGFGLQLENVLPDEVIGDDTRILHVILHTVGSLLNEHSDGYMTFRVWCDNELEDWQNQKWVQWKTKFSTRFSCVKFEIAIKRSLSCGSISSLQLDRKLSNEGFDVGLSFSMCERLVQLMQGNILVAANSQGFPESTTIVLRLQLQPPSELGGFSEADHSPSFSIAEGLSGSTSRR